MSTITGKDLAIKDLNARIQAICLKNPKDGRLELGNFRVSQDKFLQRRHELTQDTINLMLVTSYPRWSFYGNSGKMFAHLLPILNGLQLRQLFKQNKDVIYPASNHITLKPFKGEVANDPEWNTMYAKTIIMDRGFREYLLAGSLKPEDGIRHLARYPDDIDLVPLDAAGVQQLAPIIAAGKHQESVMESLCRNNSPALLPVYMDLMNEGCLTFNGHQVFITRRLIKAGYKITCARPEPAASASPAPSNIGKLTVTSG